MLWADFLKIYISDNLIHEIMCIDFSYEKPYISAFIITLRHTSEQALSYEVLTFNFNRDIMGAKLRTKLSEILFQLFWKH